MASETVSHFKIFYNFGGRCGCFKTSFKKLFWSALECGHKNTECTGKSPDPLYLCAGDEIHPVV